VTIQGHGIQVPHAQCYYEGDLHSCDGNCYLSSIIGDHMCQTALECYCEEKSDCSDPPDDGDFFDNGDSFDDGDPRDDSDSFDGGNPPAPVYSARWARCQHPYTGAGEPLQAQPRIHGAAGVLC
jgi:hypothetical protein